MLHTTKKKTDFILFVVYRYDIEIWQFNLFNFKEYILCLNEHISLSDNPTLEVELTKDLAFKYMVGIYILCI